MELTEEQMKVKDSWKQLDFEKKNMSNWVKIKCVL